MRWLQKFRMLLGCMFLRPRADNDLARELEDHLNQEIENNMREGMSAEEARYAAQRLVGPLTLFREECRDQRATAFFEDLWRDLRYAAQMLRRTPLFCAVAIVTLALGIGANTFIFTFIDNVLLRALPVPDPARLVSLNWGDGANMSYPNYVDFRNQNEVFSELVASRVDIANVSVRPRENFLAWGYEATGNYFKTIGLKPQLGRFFTPAEDSAPGAHPLIVISDRYWHRYFAADPNVLGHTIKLNGYPFTIIGVTPPEFTGTELMLACDFWVPMSMELEIEPGSDWYHQRSASNIWVMGRLKPNISKAEAEANLDSIAKQLARLYPDAINPKARFHLSRPGLVGDVLRKPITNFGIVLICLAGLVLLLACVNLAGMLLARASDRHREIGIRLALGASKSRLLRQLLTESFLLAVLGAASGFAIAIVSCRLFSSWRPAFEIPFKTTLRPDAAVLCFTVSLAVLATIMFGLTPALQSVSGGILPSLKNEPVLARLRSLSTRDVLVVAQLALSVVLVICSALVLRSLEQALTLNLGYDPKHAVSLTFDLRLKGYSTEQSKRFADTLLQKASAIPGFEAVGITSNMPLRMDHGNNSEFSRVDRPMPKINELRSAVLYDISPGYLRAAGTRLLYGRNFDDRDRDTSRRVALVNEALVEYLFPNQNPIGKRIRLSPNQADKGFEIVGVVETGKYEYLGEDPHPAVFRPVAQTGTDWTTLVARGPLPPREAISLLRKTILDLNPELSLSNVASLREQLALPLFPARAAAMILSLFGLLAMVLASTGLFALVAYSVARRTREIGIRMALGARSGQILTVIFRRTIVLSAIGIALGVAGTLVAGRLLSAILYDVSPRDPAAYACALALLIAVALLACWHPASRAVRIDPARSLRTD